MTRTELPWSQVLSIWWAAAWRFLLVGYGVGWVLGWVLAVVLGIRSELERHPVLGALVFAGAAIWPLAASVWALWFALSKEYRDFRIVIASR